MRKNTRGWVVRTIELTDDLLKKYKMKKTSDKGIFVYLSGSIANFKKLEKENPHFIVFYQKST